MNFKIFDKSVKVYYPLNKGKTRYLVLFNDNTYAFYMYKKKIKALVREK